MLIHTINIFASIMDKLKEGFIIKPILSYSAISTCQKGISALSVKKKS